MKRLPKIEKGIPIPPRCGQGDISKMLSEMPLLSSAVIPRHGSRTWYSVAAAKGMGITMRVIAGTSSARVWRIK